MANSKTGRTPEGAREGSWATRPPGASEKKRAKKKRAKKRSKGGDSAAPPVQSARGFTGRFVPCPATIWRHPDLVQAYEVQWSAKERGPRTLVYYYFTCSACTPATRIFLNDWSRDSGYTLVEAEQAGYLPRASPGRRRELLDELGLKQVNEPAPSRPRPRPAPQYDPQSRGAPPPPHAPPYGAPWLGAPPPYWSHPSVRPQAPPPSPPPRPAPQAPSPQSGPLSPRNGAQAAEQKPV